MKLTRMEMASSWLASMAFKKAFKRLDRFTRADS